MTKNILAPLLALLLALAAFGCSERGAPEASLPEADYEAARAEPMEEAGGARLAANMPPPPPSAPAPQRAEQKLIKTAVVRFEVDDYAEARERIAAQVEAHDAYIGSENETQNPGAVTNRMSIRVPADRFDALIEGLLELAAYVNERNVSVRDVTEEFVDVEARLKTRRAVEERFLDILGQARTIEDILAVENQLRTIREEIEAAEGRLNYLRDQVGLSTINLTFYETHATAAPPGRGFWGRIARSVVGGWKGLQDGLIALVGIWPLLLAGAALAWGGARWRRRRRNRRKTDTPPQQAAV